MKTISADSGILELPQKHQKTPLWTATSVFSFCTSENPRENLINAVIEKKGRLSNIFPNIFSICCLVCFRHRAWYSASLQGCAHCLFEWLFQCTQPTDIKYVLLFPPAFDLVIKKSVMIFWLIKISVIIFDLFKRVKSTGSAYLKYWLLCIVSLIKLFLCKGNYVQRTNTNAGAKLLYLFQK